ncbi:glycerol-3-phosphate dehydrogenase [Robbsia sp. KACC 23696]|uniref:glycerol-3-phosphate dehydrogenase n=1 Tax=Robbsia sp. KACC 23696 TaxID=3149231 RepID=UPI00325B4C59
MTMHATAQQQRQTAASTAQTLALADTPSQDVDLLVVGGGINGVGIARDAAGRGQRVVLCEKDDLASHTSSSSTKLIHGGLRYLEYYEFSLVRKALQEREVLLKSAPHIIWPLRFVMPHQPDLRPAWMIRAGLFLYDHLAKREFLPGSTGVSMRNSAVGAPLVDSIKRGFIYSDAWVDDARLVVLNAKAAADKGARILTRTRLSTARRVSTAAGPRWEAVLESAGADGGIETTVLRARGIANAAGPWVDHLLRDVVEGSPASHRVRLVKGSHIVTRKLFDHDHAYIFQNPDKRIIFAIPYQGDFTLIGTTDVQMGADPEAVNGVRISDEEVRYLCDSVNRYFKQSISPKDAVWSYAGVRPLLEEASDNPSAVTRDYRLDLDAPAGQAPLLSVFGGKITTFRKLAEEAVDRLAAPLGIQGASTTETETLPGGDIPGADFAAFLGDVRRRHPWLTPALSHRYARTYGTRIAAVLGEAKTMTDLGKEWTPGLYEAELAYLWTHEWARTAQDVLWRRTKLGLQCSAADADTLTEWFAGRAGGASALAATPASDSPVLPAYVSGRNGSGDLPLDASSEMHPSEVQA